MGESSVHHAKGAGRPVKHGDRTTKLRLRLMEDGRPQYIIAALAGVSPPRLSDYALGRRSIPQSRVYELCRILHCNPNELIGYAEVTTVGEDNGGTRP